MERPQQEHMAAVKHLLRYIAGTIDYGLLYSKHGNGELHLCGYSDSDLGGDVDDRKSTTGMIFFLGNMPVSWQSQKQRVVALSSCEAEYIAGAGAVCQAVARAATERRHQASAAQVEDGQHVRNRTE